MLYAMAAPGGSAGIPVPRPRPHAAGPAASDAPPGPLDWLGKLFQRGLYADGTERTLGREEIANYSVQLFSFHELPLPTPAEKK